jgi:photosystem II stability/assembly factor-like uncharacterized protein
MKKMLLVSLFNLSLVILGFAQNMPNEPKSSSDKPMPSEHPGYFDQWFERHKNAEGFVPTDLPQKWYAHDLEKSNIPQPEGESVINTIEQLAANGAQGGRTRAILIDSRDPNVLLAGGVSGGVWRSTNGGTSWRPINDAASTLSVTAFIQNPFRPNEIYYGTGEIRGVGSLDGVRGGLKGFSGGGVFKSLDGGLTFNQIASTATGQVGIDMRFVNYMAHSPVRDSTLFVGSVNGLYRSDDAGQTWAKILAGASTGIVCYANGSVSAGVQGSGVFFSANGVNFTRVNEPSFPSANVGRVLLANCKSFPNVVYAFFACSLYAQDANAGLYKSSDGGQTWIKRADSTSFFGAGRTGATYNAYCQVIGVHPNDTNKVLIGAVACIQTLDGGRTFRAISEGHADNHIYQSIGNTDEFILGNDGGLYKCNWNTPNSATSLNSSYITFQYYAGGYGPSGKLSLGGLQDNGTQVYRDDNSIRALFGADGAYCHISQQNADLAYCASQEGKMYRFTLLSSNAGFSDITPNAAVAEGAEFINHYQMNYADANQLYVRSAQGLWRSINAGNSWTKLNTAGNISGIQAIGVSAAADPSVYIGGPNCFYRFDSAKTFNPASNVHVFLRNSVPSTVRSDAWGSISFHPSVSSTLLVGLTTASNQPRAWRVTKANETTPEWTSISGNLPTSLPIYQIQAHPDRPDRVMFAATGFGLYCTTDSGKTWVKETRIPNVAIAEMKLRASDRKLFLFTHGRGAYYLDLRDLTVNTKEIKQGIAVTIYPNPTSAILNIESKDPLSMAQVFDINGREVLMERSVTNQINISELSAGTYFIRVYDNAGRFATRQFVKK